MSSKSIRKLLKNLYENKNEDADVTFLVHGVEVKAHKIIIGDRCEVLRAMISHRVLTDSKGRYVINDEKVPVESFKEFVKWLYTGDCEVSCENLGPFLHIANMYMLPSFEKKCLRFVSKACLEHGEIIRCCELALEVEDECPEMIRHCFELIRKNFYGSLQQALSDGENRASPEFVERLAKQCHRSYLLTEQLLFEAIVGWANEECKHRYVPNGMKSILTPIAKHMDPTKISLSYWSSILYPKRNVHIF